MKIKERFSRNLSEVCDFHWNPNYSSYGNYDMTDNYSHLLRILTMITIAILPESRPKLIL